MKKQTVFIHVPKTGGASILQICQRYGIRIVDHNLRNPEHRSLAQIKEQTPDIFSFAIVRNPWDRVVSTYHFLKNGGIKGDDKLDADRFVSGYGSFDEFVLEGFKDKEILDQIHFRPQYKWISDDVEVIADMVGRFEKLQLHFSRWCKMIGLPSYKLEHINRSMHKPYKAYYSAQTIELVREIYSKDIELFKYNF